MNGISQARLYFVFPFLCVASLSQFARFVLFKVYQKYSNMCKWTSMCVQRRKFWKRCAERKKKKRELWCWCHQRNDFPFSVSRFVCWFDIVCLIWLLYLSVGRCSFPRKQGSNDVCRMNKYKRNSFERGAFKKRKASAPVAKSDRVCSNILKRIAKRKGRANSTKAKCFFWWWWSDWNDQMRFEPCASR